MPVVVWVAFRFGQRETATATLAVSAFAIWGTFCTGFGPFARESPNESLLFVQLHGRAGRVALAVPRPLR